MAIHEVLNTRTTIPVELDMLGTRLCARLIIYKPRLPATYALYLEGKPITCYMRPANVLQFGRLLIPVHGVFPKHPLHAQRMTLAVPVFQAGRMVSYCRSRRWSYRAGDRTLAAAYSDNVPDLAGTLALVAV